MLHESVETPPEAERAIASKTKLGVWMFFIYALIYAGFVYINIANPLLMESTVMFGLNLAVVYGFGLIILSLILAIIYNAICIKHETAPSLDNKEGNK